MTLAQDPHKSELRAAGWHSRGYLPHFDGIAKPQFISLHLADSVPKKVIEGWKRELDTRNSIQDKILLQKRIEKYADQGYGEAFLKDHRVAEIVQDALLRDDGKKYRLRCKTETAQINEALCKVLCHNLCVVIQSMYELGVDPTFGVEAA